MTYKRASELLRDLGFTIILLITLYVFSGAEYARRNANLRELRWGLVGELAPNGEDLWDWRWGLEDHDDIGGTTTSVASSFSDYILDERLHDYDFMFTTESPPYGMIWGALHVDDWYEQSPHGFVGSEVKVSGYLEITRDDQEQYQLDLIGYIPVDPSAAALRMAHPTWGLWSIQGESSERKIFPSVYAARRAARNLGLTQYGSALHSSEYLILALDAEASIKYRVPVVGVELPIDWALLATSVIAFGISVLYSTASRWALLQFEDETKNEWVLISTPQPGSKSFPDRVAVTFELLTLRATLLILVLSPEVILVINALMLRGLAGRRWYFYIVCALTALNLIPTISAVRYLWSLLARMNSQPVHTTGDG
ncbi:MAG: hypothetical protein P8186_18645 [Anaerolineae bacterium]